MSNDAVKISDVGTQLHEEIEDGPFDRFVIFTYGITPEYLDWFDADDQVAICGPSETVESVRNANPPPTISPYNRETHAKIYLLYNESHIVAYVGSFNFTRNGLYGSVEWGARYESDLTYCPTPESLINGEAPTELSPSPIIEQIATIAGASMTGNDTHTADSWVANAEFGEGVVHTLTSNTLQGALTNMLQDAERPVRISYYTPFVTRAGISEFLSYLPETIDESDLEFELYTKRLSRLQDDESILTADEITELDQTFGGFQLRVRAPGDQGNQLGDGREIRDGMAHFKAIALSDRLETDPRPVGTILTSANLSERAWSRESAGFEIGVALKGTDDSDRLHRLFTETLSHAYVSPSNRKLTTAGGTGTPQTYGTEVWLDTRLRNRTKLNHGSVTIDWDDSLPSIESLHAILKIRDISTGEEDRHELEFDRTNDEFAASFPSIAGQQNRIIDFVRLTAETTHAPPEMEYTAREISELRAEKGIEGKNNPLPEDWQQYDEIIWNGTIGKPIGKASFEDVETVHSVQLRSTHDTAKAYYAILEPDAQPHIDQLIKHVTVGTESVAPLGELLRVCVETHSAVTPNPQTVAFYTGRKQQIHPLGFTANNEQEALYYYLSPEHAGETLSVEIDSPLHRYVQNDSAEAVAPDMSSEEKIDLEPHFSTGSWSIAPIDVHPVLSRRRYPDTPLILQSEPSPEDHISTEVPVTLNPPESLRETIDEDQLACWWRPSGVFRSGTIQPVSTPIPKQDERTRVTYRGIVKVEGQKGTINFWLSGGDYLVKEQPFVDSPEISLEGIPREQPLTKLDSETLLGWATIQEDSVLKPRARDVTKYISARLYADGESVARVVFAATQKGGVLCIPILGQHVGKTQTLTLRLWVRGGPAKSKTYTEAALDIQLSVQESNNGLEITLDNQTRKIKDSQKDFKINLEKFINNFERGVFEEQIKKDEINKPLNIRSVSPLCIQPNEMLLLCFTNN